MCNAVVSIDISTCADGSTPEHPSPFEWKYDDSGRSWNFLESDGLQMLVGLW
ncbi:MAG: hypothetical protein R2753_03100 [Chitinophagales bacterium]